MSWSFRFVGSKNAVKREVRRHIAYGDQSQLDAAKPLILAEIESMPESVTGVDVEASGHHDGHARNLMIKIQPVWLALDDEEPKPVE